MSLKVSSWAVTGGLWCFRKINQTAGWREAGDREASSLRERRQNRCEVMNAQTDGNSQKGNNDFH